MKASLLAPANATLPTECKNGDVRIMDGIVANEGRVELCFHGHWGSVCSDAWDDNDAAVICSQLGFETEGQSSSLIYYSELYNLMTMEIESER